MTESTDAAYDDIAALSGFANSTTGVWQSFTAIGALNLRAVELYGKTPDGGGAAAGVQVIIRDGTGTGGAVVTQITSATVEEMTTPGWVRFQFPSPYVATVPAGVYTIQVTGGGAEDFLWGYVINTPVHTYPDGEASFQPPSDLLFRVQVITSDVDPDVTNTFDYVETNDNTAGAPAYRFISDGATGMYLVGAGELGFTTAGSAAMSINAAGDLLPAVNDTMVLGGTLNRWANLYIGGMFQEFWERDFPIGSGWTPTVESSAGAFPITYGTQTATYVRSGTIIQLQGRVTWTASTPGAGTLRITGMPFASEASTIALLTVSLDNITYGAGNMVVGRIPANSTYIEFQVTTNGGAETTLAAAAIGATGGVTFSGSFIQNFPTPP